MSRKVQKIANVRTVKALRGQSMIIDLGRTFTGTLSAWMKKKPNDTTYRSFEIIDNRYLKLSKSKTQDYRDENTLELLEAIAGKWHFDVRRTPVGSTDVDQEEVIFTGTILFVDNITDSDGYELTEAIPTATPRQFLYLTDTPAAYGNAGQIVRMNSTGDGLVFADITAADIIQHQDQITITTSQISDYDANLETDKNFVYDQGVASQVWTINHNLDKYPAVVAVDTAQSVVVGQIDYIDVNNLTITFNASFSGEAYLN